MVVALLIEIIFFFRLSPSYILKSSIRSIILDFPIPAFPCRTIGILQAIQKAMALATFILEGVIVKERC